MPDVGLTSFTEPLSDDMRVVVKYTVEVNGLPVYSETYNVRTVAQELQANPEEVKRNWLRRITCVVGCLKRHGFSACLTRCLSDGNCCAEGHVDCKNVDSAST